MREFLRIWRINVRLWDRLAAETVGRVRAALIERKQQ